MGVPGFKQCVLLFVLCTVFLHPQTDSPDEQVKKYLFLQARMKYEGDSIKEKIAGAYNFVTGASLDLLPQNVIISGITNFLLKRATEEISLSVIKKIKDELKVDTTLNLMFKNTLNLLDHINVMGYKSSIPALRAAIQEDINNIPNNLLDIIDLPDSGNKEALKITLTGIKSFNGKTPLQFLTAYKNLQSVQTTDRGTLYKILYSIGLFSNELTLFEIDGKLNISENDLKLLKDEKFLNIYADLIQKNLSEAGIELLLDTLHFNDQTVKIFFNVKDILENFRSKEIIGLASKPASSFDERINMLLGIVNNFKPFMVKRVKADFENTERFLKSGIGVFNSVKEKNYSALTFYLIDIVSNHLKDSLSGKQIRFLALAMNIASAEDSEGLEKAFEDFADPVGSFRNKRLDGGLFYLTLNSYLGVSYGSEKLSDNKFASVKFGGAHLPVGVEFGFSTNCEVVSSIGMFLGLIDLGTLASYRLDETENATTGEEVETVPDVTFEQVFSPSACITLGISKEFPFTVGVGWQIAPKLRDIKNSTVSLNAQRVFGFFSIDLALFNFIY